MIGIGAGRNPGHAVVQGTVMVQELIPGGPIISLIAHPFAMASQLGWSNTWGFVCVSWYAGKVSFIKSNSG
jgi:hypothetical protein